MNTKNQRQRILELLKQFGTNGVNRYDLTYKHGIKQAPTRVKELRVEGYQITSRRKRNQSVDYILLGESRGSTVTIQPSIREQVDELKPVRHANGITTWESPEYFKQRGLAI